MPGLQLRRYQIAPGAMDDFVTWWRTLVPARRQYGFEVVFACVDESTNQFTWAVRHDGDFEAVEERWMVSPERTALFEGTPKRIDEAFITMVQDVTPVPT